MGGALRRLQGVSYWVIEDAGDIYDYINTEIKKEWEADARSENRDPRTDSWLVGLPNRRWGLEIARMKQIRLNPAIVNYVDVNRGYSFSKSLETRVQELQESIARFSTVIWPVIVRKEDLQLMDGYCRYATLKAMSVSKTYVYEGAL